MKTCKAVIPDMNCINTISTARHETASMETILVHSCAKTILHEAGCVVSMWFYNWALKPPVLIIPIC
jgi:hypothetical protein